MKRKKWSELEEQTLLIKYSELLNSGTLAKLKTREKKFKPVAEHVNSAHHLQDPVNFPFKWSWRDVSIKVQNMRHQYIGVKQKIRVSKDDFNWKDGENHWVNFLKYKEVFGDVELDAKEKRLGDGVGIFDHNDVLALGFGGIDCRELNDEDERDDDDDDDNEEDLEVDGATDGEFGGERGFDEMGLVRAKRLKKGLGLGRLGLVGAQVLDLRDVVVKREERRREREFGIEQGALEREEAKRELETRKEEWQSKREEELESRELELEEREIMWARKEYERRLSLEREFNKERRWRMMKDEKREEEEMEWRERIISLQMEHEKAMMQMHADACQNQMQLLGAMTRFVCQFFGSTNDGLGGGLGGLPPQVLQNLQHSGGLGDNGKPDTNSPSEFM